MTAFAPSKEETVLLLLPKKGEMYPLSTLALTRAQTSRRKLLNDYEEALILDKAANLRKIDRIEVLGPWGTSIGRKLLSRLTDAWSISVHLSEPITISLEQLKDVVVSCAQSPQSIDSMDLDGADGLRQFVVAVRNSVTPAELVACLNLPTPDAALDVL
ncbi:MAG TPA: hypothetical protein VI279_13385 [Rhodocyclaceae bacterium]